MINEDLKQKVKDKLSITWNDEHTDRKIETMMEDAKAELDHILGAETDYSASGMERSLYLEYCLYIWNGIKEEFKKEYIQDIYMIRHKNEVKAYEKKGENVQ